jgi:hypothetical protein
MSFLRFVYSLYKDTFKKSVKMLHAKSAGQFLMKIRELSKLFCLFLGSDEIRGGNTFILPKG